MHLNHDLMTLCYWYSLHSIFVFAHIFHDHDPLLLSVDLGPIPLSGSTKNYENGVHRASLGAQQRGPCKEANTKPSKIYSVINKNMFWC